MFFIFIFFCIIWAFYFCPLCDALYLCLGYFFLFRRSLRETLRIFGPFSEKRTRPEELTVTSAPTSAGSRIADDEMNRSQRDLYQGSYAETKLYFALKSVLKNGTFVLFSKVSHCLEGKLSALLLRFV